MNDFDYDVYQKKCLARSARHKINGSKSKKCTLPHEQLSAAELKRRNGNVMTYNMNEPKRWAELKAMPLDLRAEYLNRIAGEYRVSCNRLAAMAKVSGVTMGRELRKLGLHIPTTRLTREEELRWHDFLYPPTEETEEESVEAGCGDVSPDKADSSGVPGGLVDGHSDCTVSTLSFKLSGNPADAVQTMLALLSKALSATKEYTFRIQINERSEFVKGE